MAGIFGLRLLAATTLVLNMLAGVSVDHASAAAIAPLESDQTAASLPIMPRRHHMWIVNEEEDPIIVDSTSGPASGDHHDDKLDITTDDSIGASRETRASTSSKKKSVISFEDAPLGKANSYILDKAGWRIEEDSRGCGGKTHFEVVDDKEAKSRVLRVTLHDDDGNGMRTAKDKSVQREEIKSPLQSKAWSRSLPTSKSETWKYELELKLDSKFSYDVNAFYHLFQLKFESAKDGTPLLTFGARKGNLGMYVAMGDSRSDPQEFIKFGPLSEFRGKWLRAEMVLKAQTGPGATVQTSVYDAKSGKLLHKSKVVKGHMDWNTSRTFRVKLGQYRDKCSGCKRTTNTVYYHHLAMS